MYICPDCDRPFSSLEACPACGVPYCQDCLAEHDCPMGEMDEPQAEHEKVPVVDVFYDPPRMKGDARQQVFGVALDAILEEDAREGRESAAINLVGFRASCVDLGWLHDRIDEYWWKARPSPERAKIQIAHALRDVVQRLKYKKIDVTDTHIDVEIKTKDDHGWYAYSFSVYIGKDISPDGRPRLRAVGSE